MKTRVTLTVLALLAVVIPASAYVTRYHALAGLGLPIYDTKCAPGEIVASAAPIATVNGFVDVFFVCQRWDFGVPVESRVVVGTFATVRTSPSPAWPHLPAPPMDCTPFPGFVSTVAGDGCVPPGYPTAVR